MNRSQLVRIGLSLVFVLVCGFVSIWHSPYIENPQFSGGLTMGTTYSFTLSGKVQKKNYERLCAGIEEELTTINKQMSTWDPESEISQFNRTRSCDPMQVSPAFARVIQSSLSLSKSTKGAFDPTLNPLLNLWGFGSESDWHSRAVPTSEQVAQILEQCGWENVELLGQQMAKKIPALQLDLGAIAKGYGVDQVALQIKQAGFDDYYIEIGGEVVVSGVNPKNIPWRIGIQKPSLNPLDDGIQGVLHITNGAVATSGDYRNYIKKGDKMYAHLLDPRTGMSIFSEVASVTIYAPSCMQADGIATALFVMGAEEGLDWVEARADVEALFIIRKPDGQLFEKFSSGFKERTSYSVVR